MDRSQAERLLNLYEHLVRQTHDDKFISILTISDFNHQNIKEIVDDRVNNISSFDRLRHLSEFDVVLIYNLDDYLNGSPLHYESLVLWLEQYPDQKV